MLGKTFAWSDRALWQRAKAEYNLPTFKGSLWRRADQQELPWARHLVRLR